MTGFGRAEVKSGGLAIEVEARSVNSRYLDLVLRLPREYGILEGDIRALVSSFVSRGRLELTVVRKAAGESSGALRFDRALYDRLYRVYEKEIGCGSKLGDLERFSVISSLLGRREVLDVEVGASQLLKEEKPVLQACSAALKALVTLRQREGQRLLLDIRKRLQLLEDIRRKLLRHASSAPARLKEKLLHRISRLSPEVKLDPGRLACEVSLLADRVDVTEELVRLEAHLKEFAASLKTGGAGRKLDFMLQEIGREFNTIGSKAQDASEQQLVVAAKTELEKIREQTQNLE